MQARDQLQAENDGFTTFQTFLNIPTTLEVWSDLATWADSTGHRWPTIVDSITGVMQFFAVPGSVVPETSIWRLVLLGFARLGSAG